MSVQTNNSISLEQEITAALHRSAQLARDDAIKHGTSIVVQIDGEIVEITSEELKEQAQNKKYET